MNHRRLVNSALPSSILNAELRYTRSVDADLRQTFARLRRKGTTAPLKEETNVRRLPTIPREAC